MDIIACNQRHVHEHVDRMYGASCSQFGYQVSSNLCEKSCAERGIGRTVSIRYTYTVLVKISKMLDLVGIRSISWGYGRSLFWTTEVAR